MAIAPHESRRPRPSGLADVLEVVLDRGIVIDAYVRVSLVGIELLTIDARVVIASVDTYLRFAREVNRLELGGGESTQSRGLPETLGQMQQGGARSRTRGALEGAGEEVREKLGGGDEGGEGGVLQRAGRSVREAVTGGDDEKTEQQGDERNDERAVPEQRRAPSRGSRGRGG